MTDVNTAVLSTQEAAIASGSKMLRPGVTDRVVRLFEAIRAYGPPRVALERAVYFTGSFRTTEGQPLVSRWAYYGPNRDSTSPEKGLLRTWPAGGPTVLWTAPVGRGCGGPAVVGGKVYSTETTRSETR